MSLVSSLMEVSMYLLGFVIMSFGFAFIIASAFFGVREEKNLEENRRDL